MVIQLQGEVRFIFVEQVYRWVPSTSTINAIKTKKYQNYFDVDKMAFLTKDPGM